MASSRRVSGRGRLSLWVGTLGAFVALASIAYADDITNNLDASTDAAAELMPLTQGGSTGTTQLAVVPSNGDGKNGCNLTGSTTLGVDVESSDAAVATVSPSTLTFGGCGEVKILTVTPHDVGSASISVRQTSNTTGGTFNLAPATFTVSVSPPPNTPPTISVAGVSIGSSYAKGSVPAATCNVADAEDGASSFAASLSAVSGPNAADGIGQQTASCSYTDAGGLTAAASVTYGIVDPSAPGISSNVSGTLGDNDWYTSDVSLVWLVTEGESPGSLVKTGCVDQSITADQGATSYSCAASSAGGDAAESVVIKRDATAPSIRAASTFAPNAHGWSKTDVTVSFTCSDALSGLASCTAPVILSADGDDLSATGTAVDGAGNSATATVAGIKIDKTAPTITGSSSPTANAEGWNKTDVVVSFDCGDALSGVDSCEPNHTLSAEGTGLSADGTALDKAGNTATTTVGGIKIDKTAPTIAGSRSPVANAHGWNNTDVTVSFNCGDGLSGLASCSPDETFSAEGAFSALGTALDKADNSATTTVSGIRIDRTAPTVTATANKSPIAVAGTDWYKDGVTFSWSASDGSGGSGIASGPTPAASTLAATGTGYAATSQATDRADNTGTGHVNGINVDSNAPTAQFTGCPTSPLILGSAAPTITWAATDQGSGLASATSGSVALTTSTVGSKTASSPAPQDNVGHAGVAAVCTYSVVYQWHGFFQPVDNNGVFNAVKAGQGIPLKFDLDGDQGLDILANGYPKSTVVSCSGSTSEDALEEIATAGSSGLHYDGTVNPPVGQYIYVWKSDKSWAGTCRRLDLKLADGTTHSANFSFKR